MNRSKLFSFVLYSLGFMLLWEWLLPLEQITKTTEVQYFIFFVIFSLLLNFFHCPWYITWPVKGVFIFYSLFAIFSDDLGLFPWVFQMFESVKVNTVKVLSRDWLNLSSSYRSLLFFLLLWQITYLLRYWLTVKRKIFAFYLMTVFYITLLDTFTEYNGERAIVRTVITGFILLSLLSFKRMLEKEQIDGQGFLLKRWMVPLVFMISFGVAIGYLSPKAASIWPDPVPFIESKAENVGRGGISKIGYGMDDTHLGGPFINDDRVVFTVSTPTRQYWKIETKDVYTGKGWVASNQAGVEPEVIQYGEERKIDESSSSNDPVREAMFNFDIVYPHVVRPYGFLFMENEGTGFLRYDMRLDKLTSYTGDYTGDFKEVRLSKYTIKYRLASYSLKDLRGTKGMMDESDFSTLQKQYTQLPETLPERVRNLAVELTAEYDNWYDKAKAIEKYFQTGGFSYDQTRVAVPAGDEDYVDQFLFDTKRGYCDNFSTSMVVMLRSLDIPARWAKGYAPGQYKGRGENENRIYEITNNEAHSWVEVFFPSLGWVPFEPTKGFNNPVNVINDEEKSSFTAPVARQDSEETSENQPVEKEEKKITSVNMKDKKAKAAKLNEYWVAIGLGIIFISIIVVGLLISRNRWIPRLLIWKYNKRPADETFASAYEALLKRLDRLGLKREPGQTLRSYATYIDSHFDTTDMSLLTERYEKFVYGGDEDAVNWEYSREVWGNLIKKTKI